MKRRSDSTLVVLILGLLSIGGFAFGLVWVTDERPILRLRPLLAEKLGAPGLRARFVPRTPDRPAGIVIEVPERLGSVEERLEIGVLALEEYHRLAEGKTLVERCEVLVPGQEADAVVVDTQLLASKTMALREREILERQLRALGIISPEVRVVGLSRSGAKLEVRGRLMTGADGKALLERATGRIRALRYVGDATLELTYRDQTLRSRVGRDVDPPQGLPERPPGRKAP